MGEPACSLRVVTRGLSLKICSDAEEFGQWNHSRITVAYGCGITHDCWVLTNIYLPISDLAISIIILCYCFLEVS